jgi:hypothetical protein
MKNTFYHFTAKRYVNSIKREGLIKGVAPLSVIINGENKYLLLPGHQWITTNTDPDKQNWMKIRARKKRRVEAHIYTEARIKLFIPKPFMKNIMTFQDFCNKYNDILVPGFDDVDQELKDSAYVYVGAIPPQWIESVSVFQKEEKQ